MSPDDAADLESISIPSREEVREAYEQNQFQGDRIGVTIDEWSGHQEARIKEPHEHLEYSIRPSEFIEHVHGESWPTRNNANTTVFEIDRYPNLTFDRSAELRHSDELEEATDEVWQEMKEWWWNEVEFVEEIEIEGGHTVEVRYEEDEE